MDQLTTHIQAEMTELCLRIGSRHSGSAGEAAAAFYIEKFFQSCNWSTVRETFAGTGWEFESMELFNLTRSYPVPTAVPCYFSNSVEIEGELCWLTGTELANLDAAQVQGKICFLEAWDGVNNVLGRNQLAEKLDALGAAAGIFISDYHNALAASTKIQRSPFLNHMAAVAVAQAGAFDLARHKHDRYRLSVKARKFPHHSPNIIARHPGSGPRGVIGAHYDTAPLVQGASDNASGTVIMMELARYFAQHRPEMPLDFVAFAGEEYTLQDALPLGSKSYLKRHQKSGVKWFLNIDDIGLLIGEPELRLGFKEKLPPLQPGAIPFAPADQQGDDKCFHMAGIPTLYYFDRNPFHQLHTACDSLDTIDFAKMAMVVRDAINLVEQLIANN